MTTDPNYYPAGPFNPNERTPLIGPILPGSSRPKTGSGLAPIMHDELWLDVQQKWDSAAREEHRKDMRAGKTTNEGWKDYDPFPTYEAREAVKVPKYNETRSYKGDILDKVYQNYPGGSEGAIKDAGDRRTTEGAPMEPRAQLGQLDDWSLNRQNPIWRQGISKTIGPYAQVGGEVYSDYYYDAEQRPFKAMSMYKGADDKTLDEELYHTTQYSEHAPPGTPEYRPVPEDVSPKKYGWRGIPEGKPGHVAYAQKPMELGAKLTGLKHRYVQDNWGLNTEGAPSRTTKFDTKDAAAILDAALTNPEAIEDFGLKRFLSTPEGQKYIKEHKAEFLEFLMQTAQATPGQQPSKLDPPPGMFTGQDRYA